MCLKSTNSCSIFSFISKITNFAHKNKINRQRIDLSNYIRTEDWL